MKSSGIRSIMWLIFFSPSMDLLIYLFIFRVFSLTSQTSEKSRKKIRAVPDTRDSV